MSDKQIAKNQVRWDKPGALSPAQQTGVSSHDLLITTPLVSKDGSAYSTVGLPSTLSHEAHEVTSPQKPIRASKPGCGKPYASISPQKGEQVKGKANWKRIARMQGKQAQKET